MKKLLMVLMSALMVLTVGMTSKIKAATGGYPVYYKDNVKQETSQYLSVHDEGDTVTKTADDIDGYEFVSWTVTKYDGATKTEVTTSTEKELSFTMPTWGYDDESIPDDCGVVVIATYKEKEEAEIIPEDNVDSVEFSDNFKEKLAEETGLTIDENSTIVVKVTGLTTESTPTDDAKTRIETIAKSLGADVENIKYYDGVLNVKVTSNGSEKEITSESSTLLQDLGAYSSSTDMYINVNDFEAVASNKNRTWIVIRDHENTAETLGGVGTGTNGYGQPLVLFTNDKFSTFAVTYVDTDKPADTGSSNTSKPITCESEHGKGWYYSEKAGACKYGVVNTATK